MYHISYHHISTLFIRFTDFFVAEVAASWNRLRAPQPPCWSGAEENKHVFPRGCFPRFAFLIINSNRT